MCFKKGYNVNDRFILASGSPRRKELLELMGLEFKVIVSQADEDSVSKDLKPELTCRSLHFKGECNRERGFTQ